MSAIKAAKTLKQIPEVIDKNKRSLQTLINELDTVNLPSSPWGVHIDSKHNFVTFSVVNIGSNCVKTPKAVVVSETKEHVLKINTFMNNVPVQIPDAPKTVANIQELNSLLKTIDAIQFCKYYSVNKENGCSTFCSSFTDVCNHCSNYCNKTDNFKNTAIEKWVQSLNKDMLCDVTCTANENKTIRCILCQENFKTNVQLTKHETSHLLQNNKGQFECTVCLKIYDGVTSLVEHYKVYHCAVKFIKCTVCDNKYNNPQLLKNHARNHRKCQTSICSRCGQYFTSQVMQKQHLCVPAVEKPGTSKAYICKTCNTKYATNHLLWQHQKEHHLHVSLTCKKCIRNFDSKEQALVHKIKCRNENMKYACKICKKKFSCISQKMCHMKRLHLPMQ